MRQLSVIGWEAEYELQLALANGASVEAGKKIGDLLARIGSPDAVGWRVEERELRFLRVVHVLERVANGDATQLLRKLAHGEADDSVRYGAIVALARLFPGRRSGKDGD